MELEYWYNDIVWVIAWDPNKAIDIYIYIYIYTYI